MSVAEQIEADMRQTWWTGEPPLWLGYEPMRASGWHDDDPELMWL